MNKMLAPLASLVALAALATPAIGAGPPTSPALSADTINSAQLSDVPVELAPPAKPVATQTTADNLGWPVLPPPPAGPHPDPAIVRVEILLDRAGASPGVIDGLDGENLRKAISAFEIMQGGKPDGLFTPELAQRLDQTDAVIGSYVITDADAQAIVPSIPKDYGEMAKLKFLGYTSLREELAERFHMDEKFLQALNPQSKFAPGETILGAITGPDRTGKVAHIEADKGSRQVRAYDAEGKLLAAYPATIGSTATPSPSGTHTVLAVVHNPTYTYNPDINFKQGNNDKVLTIPPGPNGPVGSIWIDLSEPTFGIHGTPEPSQIDKSASHGCVRLTNWDAEELAGMVSKGVTVDFVS